PEGFGHLVIPLQFEVNSQREVIYIAPLYSGTVFCFDLDTGSEVFRRVIASSDRQIPRLTPDQSSLYVYSQTSFLNPPLHKQIDILDAETGAVIGSIPLDEESLPPGIYPLYPADLQFVPGMDKAYLASGWPPEGSRGAGKIVTLDLKQGIVDGALPHVYSFYGGPGDISVLPKQ
ncbi:MAG: hypothetical protein AB1752_01155, partial [Candidatus Zixiibacteriota bacterium]